MHLFHACFQILADVIRDVTFLIGAGDYIHAFHCGYLLRAYLCIAPCDDHNAVGIHLFHASYVLTRFLVRDSRHRACVYYIYICKITLVHDFTASGSEILRYGLGLILVDFAAQCMECYFHTVLLKNDSFKV